MIFGRKRGICFHLKLSEFVFLKNQIILLYCKSQGTNLETYKAKSELTYTLFNSINFSGIGHGCE